VVSTLAVGPDCNVNGDLGESFRTILRNALDYPTDECLTQLDWLKESMRMEDIDVDSKYKVSDKYTHRVINNICVQTEN